VVVVNSVSVTVDTIDEPILCVRGTMVAGTFTTLDSSSGPNAIVVLIKARPTCLQ
jgi:hypothetical protein